MNKLKKVSAVLTIFAFTFALISVANAQTSTENMETFFDTVIPGIEIQVNATAEAQPTENITVIFTLKRTNDVSDVYINYFNLSIYGFIQGKEKTLIANISEDNFPLYDTPKEQNFTFPVPEQVWDATYGEIILTYSAKYGIVRVEIDQLTCGFAMTIVGNVYLEKLEDDFESLNESYAQLNQSYWDLQQNYTALQGSLNELDNTRRAVAIFAITTVFFVATTAYLILRKPKEHW